jgi:hypothetical protein
MPEAGLWQERRLCLLFIRTIMQFGVENGSSIVICVTSPDVIPQEKCSL